MSRIENTGKNFIYSFLGTILTSVLSFVTRTVFIRTIGVDYLGANSLFTNILSMLSLTELGIGSAIAFSLYRPLAYQDTETIKSLMSVYQKAYRVIAAVIAVFGLALLPVLKYLIKDPGNIQHIHLIYVVFLYNTVVSYLFSYKTTLLSADQKSYLMTNISMLINVITAIIQLGVMLLTGNYFVYLFVGMVINTVQWFFINRYIYKRYPYLTERDVKPLGNREKKEITTNVKAMVFHKFGELCINQTDNIIISSFISITAVGIYNNYYMIIGIINRFASSMFSAATASLGNLIATESCHRRYEVFRRYNFLGFWTYSWTGICLFVLLDPFVSIWLGDAFRIDQLTLSLVMINYYLVGMRTTIGNVKIAAGLYAQDQWAPIVQSVINLAVSIVGAINMGLAGVFLGTVVSSIAVPCWYRPVVVYKYTFERSVKSYFVDYFKYLGTAAVCLALVMGLNAMVIDAVFSGQILNFLGKMAVCSVVPNAVIIVLYHGCEEYQYIKQMGMRLIRKVMKK